MTRGVSLGDLVDAKCATDRNGSLKCALYFDESLENEERKSWLFYSEPIKRIVITGSYLDGTLLEEIESMQTKNFKSVEEAEEDLDF